MSTQRPRRLGILVGGGPAPGINSVICAATIRAELEGYEVTGIEDGFRWIMHGNTERVVTLTTQAISRIHFRGGSFIGISRANPTEDPVHLRQAADALAQLGITRLITIGGDDTAFSAMKLADLTRGELHVVHVPKTIDNDLALPPDVDTFGFQTARHAGVQIVKNIMVDAHTTHRWYFIIAMGRKTGHLALGIGKAAGATLTLIPEEFGHGPIRLATIVDTLVGAIVKRTATGRPDGVAVIAEGVVLGIAPDDLASLEEVERDDHGHLRIAEVDIGEILKKAVQAELAKLGMRRTIVSKNVGYELRCADPVPSDMDYTRDLGYCAAKYLVEGGDHVFITMQGGRFVPIPFEEMIDPETGRTRVRGVDVSSTRYAIARRFMIRLRRDDFEMPEELARMAEVCGLGDEAFRARFEPLVAEEAPAIRLLED
jgi:6-phosphofructokinase 1